MFMSATFPVNAHARSSASHNGTIKKTKSDVEREREREGKNSSILGVRKYRLASMIYVCIYTYTNCDMIFFMHYISYYYTFLIVRVNGECSTDEEYASGTERMF